MKIKKFIIPLILVVLCFLCFIFWTTPTHLTNYKYLDDISEITIRDGSSGVLVNIHEKEDMELLLNTFNNTEIKKDGISLGFMGYTYNVTITANNKKQSFIVNKDNIRTTLFFNKIMSDSKVYDIITDIMDKYVSNNMIDGETTFNAIIEDIQDNVISIRPTANSNEINSSSVITFAHDNADKFKIGDMIEVEYDGTIMESFPAQITATNITLVDIDNSDRNFYSENKIIQLELFADNSFYFSYDPLSSTIITGRYTETEDRITITDSLINNEYVFNKNGNILELVIGESSPFEYIDKKITENIITENTLLYLSY